MYVDFICVYKSVVFQFGGFVVGRKLGLDIFAQDMGDANVLGCTAHVPQFHSLAQI